MEPVEVPRRVRQRVEDRLYFLRGIRVQHGSNTRQQFRAMIDNTEAQRRLHPALVGPDAGRIIEIARRHAALGWKVNGAGGDGGSLTLLCGPRSDEKRAMLRAIQSENPRYQHIPIYLSRFGLRVW